MNVSSYAPARPGQHYKGLINTLPIVTQVGEHEFTTIILSLDCGEHGMTTGFIRSYSLEQAYAWSMEHARMLGV